MTDRYLRPTTGSAEDSILRVDLRAGGWQAVTAVLINDDRLGLDTRGFAAWLLGRPPGWKLQATALPKLLTSGVSRVGREKARRFLKELERANYLTRTRRRGLNGRWHWDICFRPTPVNGRTATVTIDGLAAGGSAVGGSAVDSQPVHYLQTQISSKQDKYQTKTSTTRTSASETDPGVTDGELMEIRFPEILTGHLLAVARKRIPECPREHRQAVLDELAAMIAQRAARHPIGLLRCLIQKAKEGEFKPNRSKPGRASTPPSTRYQGRPGNGATPTSESPLRPAAEIARNVIVDLRERFQPGTS